MRLNSSAKLPSEIVGFTQTDNAIIDSRIAREADEYYKQVILAQLACGYDCVISEDGDSLIILRTHAKIKS